MKRTSINFTTLNYSFSFQAASSLVLQKNLFSSEPINYQSLTTFECMSISSLRDSSMQKTREETFGFYNLKNHLSQKRKRSGSRSVFSNLQRKGLERQFEIQKYITKPDRRRLAQSLNLTDSQVRIL